MVGGEGSNRRRYLSRGVSRRPSTTQHNTTQHNITQHYTTQHNPYNTTQHNINTTLHITTHHTTTQHNTHFSRTLSRLSLGGGVRCLGHGLFSDLHGSLCLLLFLLRRRPFYALCGRLHLRSSRARRVRFGSGRYKLAVRPTRSAVRLDLYR